jgi:hypothetical protein
MNRLLSCLALIGGAIGAQDGNFQQVHSQKHSKLVGGSARASVDVLTWLEQQGRNLRCVHVRDVRVSARTLSYVELIGGVLCGHNRNSRLAHFQKHSNPDGGDAPARLLSCLEPSDGAHGAQSGNPRRARLPEDNTPHA